MFAKVSNYIGHVIGPTFHYDVIDIMVVALGIDRLFTKN